MPMWVQVPSDAREGIGFQELELQDVVNHLMWVLGTELWASERLACALFLRVGGDRVALCSSGCPGTHYIDQADLQLKEICLPPPSERWD